MPYWMWIGNVPTQYNSTPASNLTTAEAASLVGYEAAGSSEIRPVMMNGQQIPNPGNFQTTFNTSYGISSGYGGSNMSYTHPVTGAAVSGAKMTTAIQAQIRISDLDVSGNEVVVGTFTGLIVQMSNGDMFFRPVPAELGTWSAIDSIYSIEVMSTTLIANSTAIDPSVGFNTDIVDLVEGDGIVDGTSGADVIGAGYVDHNGDEIDASDNTGAFGGTVNSNDDVVRGFGGNDSISSGAGNDTVFAGNGNDTVYGGDGDDRIYGYGDSVEGDSLYGGDDGSADLLYGGAGNDMLFGGFGNDTLYGGTGNDSLFGGAGSDSLYGGAGNDLISGGAGADTMTGGAGVDVFVVNGADLITDFGTGNTGPIDDGDNTNNDFVDLTAYYNETSLAAWNAAHPSETYKNPLQWMQADQADGILDAANGLRIQNDGSAVAGSALTTDTTGVTCFSRGTLIKTSLGEVAVEDLRIGHHLVLTVDNGYRELRWIGRRRFGAEELASHPHLRPIRIRAGALGTDSPVADLVVSPQHRILVASKIVERISGEHCALVAAKHLVGLPGIEVDTELDEIEYWHFLFDDHEVVWSNGAQTESMYTGKEAIKALGDAERREIFTIFPELEHRPEDERPLPARVLLTGRQGRDLTRRHMRQADRHQQQTRVALPTEAVAQGFVPAAANRQTPAIRSAGV